MSILAIRGLPNLTSPTTKSAFFRAKMMAPPKSFVQPHPLIIEENMKFGFLSMFMLRGGNDFCERVPEEKLRHLRKVGIQVIKRKDYEQALRCYSALVQLYEGLPGQKMAWYRMQCGITLAECHMHLGNTEEAIARFSDVIDEFPIIDTFVHNDENSDQHDEQEDKQISAVDYRGDHVHDGSNTCAVDSF